ncbi:hypothetical protein C0W80_18880 [Photobacterium leiognathi subsp. mandapamensis]|uniref:hypothetical protein n=1 Tax=Photobacterium leiognathi TaxID=553611 RepID=UPI000D166B19|nr:hypothetical protein [Photobacterium leiognathi]PSU95238.1 hypothetical protein C0W80_18880 [Photobacterium leiognathi subsp. mandapamensis]
MKKSSLASLALIMCYSKMLYATDIPNIYLSTLPGHPLTVIARVTSPTKIEFTSPSDYLTCSKINSYKGVYPQNHLTNLNYQFYNPKIISDGDEYRIELGKDSYLSFSGSYPHGSINEWGNIIWSSAIAIDCLDNISEQVRFPTYSSDFNFLKNSLKVNYVGKPGEKVVIPRKLIGYYGYSMSYGERSKLPFLPNQSIFAIYVEGEFVIPSNTCSIKTQTLNTGNILPGTTVDKKLSLDLTCVGPGLSEAKWKYNNINYSGSNNTNLKNVDLIIKNNKDQKVEVDKYYKDLNELNALSIVVDAKNNAQLGKLNVPLRFTLTYT